MYQALYLKWRPARFNEVVGQKHITVTLTNAVAAGRIGHAYLFAGPRGTGKTTTARLLAKAANCVHEELAQRPCGKCAPCQAVAEGRFLDLIEIDAASNTGVDDIRGLREKINFAPSEGRFKVYIIDEVHMLSTAAFNALLKTLEEPPTHAIFILATTEVHKVPLTIKSRCQQFSFRLLTAQEIISRLVKLAEFEELSVEPQAISMIAAQAQGSLRDAESLLDQLVAAPGETITLERAQMVLGTASNAAVEQLTEAWLSGDGRGGLAVIHESLKSGADARQFTRQMVDHLRKLLLIQTAGAEVSLDITREQLEKLHDQSRLTDRHSLIEALKIFSAAASDNSPFWQPQLPLELAFIQLLPPQRAYRGESTHTNPPDTTRQKPSSGESILLRADEASNSVSESEKAEQDDIDQLVDKSSKPALESNNLTLEQVVGNWSKLRSFTAREDSNLPNLLSSAKPLATDGNTLILGFDFPVLKKNFDSKPSAIAAVIDGLNHLFGTPCQVKTVITSQFNTSSDNIQINQDEFAAIAEELGGTISGADSG